jgi:hypothetical protein
MKTYDTLLQQYSRDLERTENGFWSSVGVNIESSQWEKIILLGCAVGFIFLYRNI